MVNSLRSNINLIKQDINDSIVDATYGCLTLIALDYYNHIFTAVADFDVK